MRTIMCMKTMAGAAIAFSGLFATTQASAEGLGQGDVIINEWNAVGPNKFLEQCDPEEDDWDEEACDGGDLLFGVEAPGNGGDWIELVVIEDGADLRELVIEWRNDDGAGKHGFLDFSTSNLWRGSATPSFPGLNAGTIILIRKGGIDGMGTQNFPTAASIASSGNDPVSGTWNQIIYLDTNGSYVSERTGAGLNAFQSDNDNWRARILDDYVDEEDFALVQSWVGEAGSGCTFCTSSGINSREVGKLEADPTAGAASTTPGCYNDGHSSTAGAANKWTTAPNSYEQCFSGLTGYGSCTPLMVCR